MNMQPPTTRSTIMNVPALLAAQSRREVLLFIAIFFTVCSITPLLILGGISIGFTFVLSGLVVLAVAALIVRWPLVGLYVVAACAILVEQRPIRASAPLPIDQIFIFSWPAGLDGQVERPIGYLFIFIIFMLVCLNLFKYKRPLRGGVLIWPFLLYLLCVAIGVVHGLTSGGDPKIIVGEVRPAWYLFVSYLLAYNLLTHKSHLRAFFWLVILGAGVKALQGFYIFLVVLHGNLQGHHEIMAHEESFFFVALLILLVLLCLHYRYRPQLYAILLVLPFLLVALLANQRRTDYVALVVAMVVVWVMIFWMKPQFRKQLVVGMLIVVALGTVYVAVFANASSLIAEPARGIMSIFQPNSTDYGDFGSNLYRAHENYDLLYTAKLNSLFGFGYGKRFFQPIVLTNVLAADPIYLFVPHNTVYWILVRLGPVGYLVFWYLIGAIIVRGCLISRQLKDRYLQMAAIYIVAVIFIEITVAFADYQLFDYRNVIYVGLLVGILMKLPALVSSPEEETGVRYAEKGEDISQSHTQETENTRSLV